MKKAPWHSRLPILPLVYHDESTCTVGNNIETYNRVPGMGGRRKCTRCREISG